MSQPTPTYTADEFREAAHVRGLSTKPIVELYIKDHPRAFYTEDDLIEVYRRRERILARRDCLDPAHVLKYTINRRPTHTTEDPDQYN